jgi:hypothetical protein
MPKKTYRTYHLKGLQILLTDKEGRLKEVNFKKGAQIDSTARYTTNDEWLQKALEKCSGFNRDYYLENVQEDTPSHVSNNGANWADGSNGRGDDPAVRTVDVPDKAAAIEWLKENYPDKGYTTTKLTRSKEEFNNACAECGVVFNIG